MEASWGKYLLRFREPAVTSRSVMTEKPTWFLTIKGDNIPGGRAVGEVAMFPGLSAEDTPDFERLLDETCTVISQCRSHEQAWQSLPPVSSIRFGYESAMLLAGVTGYETPGEAHWLAGEIGIPINGLIWMGDKATMTRRIRQKLDDGFHCIKLKIGGIDFADELDLLRMIRREFSPSDIELRLDANGAFTPANALERLKCLSEFTIHSIEQPIRAGQWEEMGRLCSLSPIPIALDEELIGFRSDKEKKKLLRSIRPQYIILKPSLCGGILEADNWIELAEKEHIGWWGTSALESNIGLTALGIWAAAHSPSMPQGLGTGALYTNNIPAPLSLEGDMLYCRRALS